MKDHVIGINASTMSTATVEEWQKFIGLLGGRAAMNLKDAMEDFNELIERQRVDDAQPAKRTP